MSVYDGDAAVMVGATDSARARIRELIPNATSPSDRVLVIVFQGSQRTGGYTVHVTRIERDGDRLVVHASFSEPGPGAFVTQVLTSPAHVVSIARADAFGAALAIVLDASGTERARATMG